MELSSQNQVTSNLESQKRPWPISAICILGFIVYGLAILLAFFYPPYHGASIRFGDYYMPNTLFTIAISIATFIPLVGYWKMKKWGVSSYVVVNLLGFLLGYIASRGQLLYDVVGTVFPGMAFAIGLIYFKKMK